MRIKCVAWTLAAPSSLRMAEGIRLIVMSCYQRLRTAAECIPRWVYAHKVVAYRSEMDRRYRGRAQLRYLEHIAEQYATVSGASSFFTHARRRGTPDNYRVLDGFMRINTVRDRQCASSPDLEGIASQGAGPGGFRHRRACSIDGSDASMRLSLPKFMRTNSPPSKQPPSTIERRSDTLRRSARRRRQRNCVSSRRFRSSSNAAISRACASHPASTVRLCA